MQNAQPGAWSLVSAQSSLAAVVNVHVLGLRWGGEEKLTLAFKGWESKARGFYSFNLGKTGLAPVQEETSVGSI